MESPVKLVSYLERFARQVPLTIIFINSRQKVVWANDAAQGRVEASIVSGIDIADMLFEFGIPAEEVGEVLEWVEDGVVKEVVSSSSVWSSVSIDPMGDGGAIICLNRRGEVRESGCWEGLAELKAFLNMLRQEAESSVDEISRRTELIADELGGGLQSQQLDGIAETCRALIELWDKAQEYVSVHGGSEPATLGAFLVRETIEDAVRGVAGDLASCQTRLVTKLGEEVPRGILGDRKEFGDLVCRLIGCFCDCADTRLATLSVNWIAGSREGEFSLRMGLQASDRWTDSIADFAGNEGECTDSTSLCFAIVSGLVKRSGGKIAFCEEDGRCDSALVDLPYAPSFDLLPEPDLSGPRGQSGLDEQLLGIQENANEGVISCKEGIAILNFSEWENDEELHRRMIAMFMEDAPSSLAEIRKAERAKDPGGLERWVHYFKGAADVVRADRLTEICLSILGKVRDGDIDGALTALPRLYGDYEEFEVFVRESMPSLSK